MTQERREIMLRTAIAGVTRKNEVCKMTTMHEAYGEANDRVGKHLCCDKCGFCITCKDCVCKKRSLK